VERQVSSGSPQSLQIVRSLEFDRLIGNIRRIRAQRQKNRMNNL
jgi:hypothetical protein